MLEVRRGLPVFVELRSLGHPRQHTEVLDVVDITEPEAGPGQQLYDISTAGVNYADMHHRLSAN